MEQNKPDCSAPNLPWHVVWCFRNFHVCSLVTCVTFLCGYGRRSALSNGSEQYAALCGVCLYCFAAGRPYSNHNPSLNPKPKSNPSRALHAAAF